MTPRRVLAIALICVAKVGVALGQFGIFLSRFAQRRARLSLGHDSASAHAEDPARDALAETWFIFDPNPPSPATFAAARAFFDEVFIAELIINRGEIGGLDDLRHDLLGALLRRATWEVAAS